VKKEWPADDLRQTIADFAGVSVPVMNSGSRRSPVAAARAMLVYAAQEWLGMTGAALSRWLGITSSSISKAHRRGRPLAQECQLFDYLNKDG
jgi:hypothetical protein